MNNFDLQLEFLLETDERNHDFRIHFMPFFCTSAAASKIARACISVISGIGDAETATAMAEHRVELVQLFARAASMFRQSRPASSASSACAIRIVRQKFMQRRIEQADRGRQAIERFENANEIARLIRKQFRERLLSLFIVFAPESFPASRRCDRLRKTCARSGRDRCPARRTRSRSPPARACRRWCARSVRVTSSHQSISCV